jgi:hypothetical protein
MHVLRGRVVLEIDFLFQLKKCEVKPFEGLIGFALILFALPSELVLGIALFDFIEEVPNVLRLHDLLFEDLLVKLFENQLPFQLLVVDGFHEEGPHFFKVDYCISDLGVEFNYQVKDFAIVLACLVEGLHFVFVLGNFLPCIVPSVLAHCLVLGARKVVYAASQEFVVGAVD